MIHKIAKLSGHTIVCGGGKTGAHVVSELLHTGRDFVLIERDAERITQLYRQLHTEFPGVAGDCTEDETLIEAGIERAAGLVTCIDSDKDNIVVCFSASALNPELRIIARASGPVREKMLRAGASSVVSPDQIGGLRMVSEMVRPAVVSFLDIMLRDKDRNLRFEEARVHEGSELDGMTVGTLRGADVGDMLIVAVRTGPDSFEYNPSDDHTLKVGECVVFIGSPAAREMAQALGHKGG